MEKTSVRGCGRMTVHLFHNLNRTTDKIRPVCCHDTLPLCTVLCTSYLSGNEQMKLKKQQIVPIFIY